MNRVIEIKPHMVLEELPKSEKVVRIFLAGTIDNGNSEDWQSEYISNMRTILTDAENYNPNANITCYIYNPRRSPGTGFTPDNTEEMNYQVNWELDHMEKSDFIYMNLLANSKSPISLMELGLFAHSNKLRVVCPKEFYRYHNVRIVCERNNIPFKTNHDEKWSVNPS